MTRITKDTTIGEAIQYDAGIVSILMGAHHQQVRL